MPAEIFRYDQAIDATDASFKFEDFWTSVESRFLTVSIQDIDTHMRKSNNLRRALQAKAALSPTKRGVLQVPLNPSKPEKDREYVEVYSGENINSEMFTYRRFMACIGMKAIEAEGDFVNPLAERAGFTIKEGRTVYTLFCPGGEFLFFKYPNELAALTCWRTEHYDTLGIKVDKQADVFNSLSRQTYQKMSFSDWINSCDPKPIREIYNVINRPRDQTKAISTRSQKDFDTVLRIVRERAEKPGPSGSQ